MTRPVRLPLDIIQATLEALNDCDVTDFATFRVDVQMVGGEITLPIKDLSRWKISSGYIEVQIKLEYLAKIINAVEGKFKHLAHNLRTFIYLHQNYTTLSNQYESRVKATHYPAQATNETSNTTTLTTTTTDDDAFYAEEFKTSKSRLTGEGSIVTSGDGNQTRENETAIQDTADDSNLYSSKKAYTLDNREIDKQRDDIGIIHRSNARGVPTNISDTENLHMQRPGGITTQKVSRENTAGLTDQPDDPKEGSIQPAELWVSEMFYYVFPNKDNKKNNNNKNSTNILVESGCPEGMANNMEQTCKGVKEGRNSIAHDQTKSLQVDDSLFDSFIEDLYTRKFITTEQDKENLRQLFSYLKKCKLKL